jgi:hypothetical protein
MDRLRQVARWLEPRVTPRTILLAALGLFLIYSFPGFVGWDTRDHILQARGGVYSDGHPPAINLLVRICEVFVTGPLLVLLIQAVTLLVGLNMLFARRFTPRVAALCAAGVFLFPPVSGVQALIAKDGVMAGTIVIAIALMLDERASRHRLALLFLFIASLMRWNGLAATFAPMILLFRWSPTLGGWRRYAIAFAAWFGVTAAAYQVNDMLTDEREHIWHWAYAYTDIAGTLEQLPPKDDAEMRELFEGVPIRFHENMWQRLHEVYNPASHYHLMRGEKRSFDIAADQAQRDAIARTWKRVVLGNPLAYMKYRWENFKLLIQLDRPKSFSNVYVWLTVIASPETIPELQHDAHPSRIQAQMIEASIWISLTPIYWITIYVVLCLVLLPLCLRRALEASLLLSGIGYQLQWFFLAATPDVRYSQWLELCVVIVIVLLTPRVASVIRRR